MTPDPHKGFTQRFIKSCKIPEEFRVRRNVLPTEYEQYLNYYRLQVRSRQTVQGVWKILSGFDIYLQKSNSSLCKISIEQVDHFLGHYNKNYTSGVCRTHRSNLRQFLKYLYREGYIKKDLAPLVVSPPDFGRSNPPKFLRPKEVEKVFNSLDLSNAKDLRTYAGMHLIYYLGLRPKEISLITLDDISFKQKEIFIRSRKNFSPAHLPLPDDIIKAITAYIVGGRPKSERRTLFLQIVPPYQPVKNNNISHFIRKCMHKNNLKGSTYWLRHSYAQNLLEAGASIFEIKEMMGHKNIESSRKYLSIHINLMRKIILDETV
ncbi:MAG: tyrosine-type recombinase/integrase [Desulfobacula sp.]|uniref:tyrosine-type recombinase/integrase n=1 Tax=Desulfobacula sp. TaxID=2593537 RepID=UPI0025BF5266|nr:tyrosine-type recombinase/integrase [Desulfobacula sp.]MCD4718505.1 tyrosine-type recombinase/integrase [Desulfobacula sp.]